MYCAYPGIKHDRNGRIYLGQKRDQRRNIKNHVGCCAVLDEITIEPSTDAEAVPRVNFTPRYKEGTQWQKCVERLGSYPLPTTTLALPSSRRYIIRDRIACNEIKSLLRADVLAFTANDDSELCFVVNLRRVTSHAGDNNSLQTINGSSPTGDCRARGACCAPSCGQ